MARFAVVSFHIRLIVFGVTSRYRLQSFGIFAFVMSALISTIVS